MAPRAKPSRPGPRRRGRPRGGATEATPAAILELAVEEFGRHGFDGANLGEIARRAGVAKPLVHYHFENKETLWRAAVDHVMAKLRAEFRNLQYEARGLDAVSMIRLLVRRYAFFCARNPQLARIVLGEVLRGTDRSKWLLETHLVPMYRTVDALVREIQSQGGLRPVESYQLIPIVNGALNAFLADLPVIQRVAGAGNDDDEAVFRHAEAVVDVILNGILP